MVVNSYSVSFRKADKVVLQLRTVLSRNLAPRIANKKATGPGAPYDTYWSLAL